MSIKSIEEINKKVDKINSNDKLNKTEKLFHLLILKNEVCNIKKRVLNQKDNFFSISYSLN